MFFPGFAPAQASANIYLHPLIPLTMTACEHVVIASHEGPVCMLGTSGEAGFDAVSGVPISWPGSRTVLGDALGMDQPSGVRSLRRIAGGACNTVNSCGAPAQVPDFENGEAAGRQEQHSVVHGPHPQPSLL